MIDLHTHILPGIDDGSPSMEASLAMAELALEGGVGTIVATPHSNQMGRFENFYSNALFGLYQAVKEELAEEALPLNLHLGMEIMASEDMGDRIRRGELISLNHSRYYLVEFVFDEIPERIEDYLEKIFQAKGVPLIAHPERYYCVQDYPELVYDWLRMGCYTQINKGSLFGKFGRHAAGAAQELLENDLVTCVASDAHSPYARTTYMADTRDYLEEQYGEERMYRLTKGNPLRILSNRTIPAHGRMPERRSRFF